LKWDIKTPITLAIFSRKLKIARQEIIGEHRMNWMNRSLKTKLKIFMFSMLTPMVCLVLYMIARFSTYTDRYAPIIHDINIANAFDIHFKQEVDYAMYRIAIGSEKFENTEVEQVLKKSKVYFKQLEEGTNLQASRKQVQMAQRNLELLEKKIYQIKDNCQESGHYDVNMFILENDIYVFTELITDQIKQYVYYEALELEEVKYAIEKDINKMLQMILWIFAIVLGITWMLIIVISNSISKPLQYLCELTKQVGEGDFSLKQPKSRGDEVMALEKSFHTMVGKIESLVENVKKEQINLRQMELKLLQVQINPHFLYNTLDTISWMAEDGRTDDVVEMVLALSAFFRTGLSKGRDYITLKEEESHIRSYLQIQQFRYGDILNYEIDIPEAIGDCMLLKLTLQPLVENALYHGIKQKRGKGKIKVSADYDSSFIVLKVEDDGIGMKEDELQTLRQSVEGGNLGDSDKGFGLGNVHERIRLNYGKGYGVVIDSIYEEGTCVTVCLPFGTSVPKENILLPKENELIVNNEWIHSKANKKMK
jgi:two-component system sensor histidine kinase YesM